MIDDMLRQNWSTLHSPLMELYQQADCHCVFAAEVPVFGTCF
jgi:hypothetical protein